MLSICTITYNHQKYIANAIDSFLNQKTSFPLEIIIVDDNSQDNTFNICQKYADGYPDQIKLYNNDPNIGPVPNLARALHLCNGKYIAWCEGDDYWTDPYKIQKQVDFLEANPNFTLSFHNAVIKWEDKSQLDTLFCPPDQKLVCTIEDVIKSWFIPSASMVFRRDAIMPLPEWFPEIYNGDWALQMIVASKGKINYMNEPMSVYRKSSTSLSGTIGKNIEFVNRKRIDLLQLINKITNGTYEKTINESVSILNYEIRMSFLRKNNYALFIFKKAALRMRLELSKFFYKYTSVK